VRGEIVLLIESNSGVEDGHCEGHPDLVFGRGLTD